MIHSYTSSASDSKQHIAPLAKRKAFALSKSMICVKGDDASRIDAFCVCVLQTSACTYIGGSRSMCCTLYVGKSAVLYGENVGVVKSLLKTSRRMR